VKSRRGKGSYRSRGGAGGRRRQRRRGGRRASGNREEHAKVSVRKSRRSMGKKIQFAEQAYCENTNKDIRRIIQQLEEEAIQGQSDSEMKDWEYLLSDPGNTRGHMTLYKQTLHVYWIMKRLLAKEMEQVAMEMAELSQGIPNLKKELQNIQITMLM